MFTAAQASQMSDRVVDLAVSRILDLVKEIAAQGSNHLDVKTDGFETEWITSQGGRATRCLRVEW